MDSKSTNLTFVALPLCPKRFFIHTCGPQPQMIFPNCRCYSPTSTPGKPPATLRKKKYATSAHPKTNAQTLIKHLKSSNQCFQNRIWALEAVEVPFAASNSEQLRGRH